MSFLKSTAISLLSFILFLALSLFSTVYMLDKTLLDPDFVAAEINGLDVPALAREMLRMETPPGTPDTTEVINKTVTDLEPWMKEEVSTLIHTGYDYLLGRTDKFSLTISTATVKNTLKENITETIVDSPPPELKSLPPAALRQYADQAYEQFAGEIPDTIELTESSIPPDVMDMLKLVRSYLSYYQTAFYGLITLMVLCAASIFLISRDVKYTTRSIGTTLVTYGVIGYAIPFALSYFHLEEQLMGMAGGIPASLQTWITQLMNDFTAPMKTFSLALLVTGVVLVIVSIVYPRRQPKAEPAES